MATMSLEAARRLGPLLLPGLAVVFLLYEFVLLVVTYLGVGAVAPTVLGAMVERPVWFAAWIALATLPFSFAYLLAVSWRSWVALIVRGEVLELPLRTGWRLVLTRVGGGVAAIASSVMGALIVFRYVSGPGDVPMWQAVAVTAAGPFLLPRAVAGLFRLLRRWCRPRRPARPEAPDD